MSLPRKRSSYPFPCEVERKNLRERLKTHLGIKSRQFSNLSQEEQDEVGRKLRNLLHPISNGSVIPLVSKVLKDGEIRKMCALRGIPTMPLKEEDIKREPTEELKIEPCMETKQEPKEEPKIEPKTEPKDEPDEDPAFDTDVDELMAEAEADIPRWRSAVESFNATGNNNEEGN